MPIEVYEHDRLPAALRWQVMAFLRVEWPFIFAGDGRLAEQPYPLSMPQVHVAAAEGDVLLSYATLVQFDLRHEGEMFRVLGLGNVFTFPPYRGEGLARQVIDAASDRLRASDADFGALLCEPRYVPMYAGSGWEAATAPTFEGTPDDAKPVDATLMLLLVSPRALAARQTLFGRSMYVAEKW